MEQLPTHHQEHGFLVSHIYREGNSCADGTANLGLSLFNYDIIWWNNSSDSI